jgi:hypothetical protein
MDISKIKFSRLRNGEHVQFHTEVDELIAAKTPTVLGIEAQYAIYKLLFGNEYDAFDVIRKSAVTEELEAADVLRDSINSGMNGAVKSALNHFNADVKKAANRVWVVLNSFGNISVLAYDEETVSIRKLNAELTANYAAEVQVLGLTEWLAELTNKNDAFDALMKLRYSEDSGKTMLRMRPQRLEVDEAYRKIIKRIDALIEINGEDAYKDFVSELNIRVDKYNNVIARREGSNSKKNEASEVKADA